jgi:hypothetical protein
VLKRTSSSVSKDERDIRTVAAGPDRIIHRGTGPYPEPCAFCGAPIAGDENYVITDDGAVRHEVCQFFLEEDEAESDPEPPGDLPNQ